MENGWEKSKPLWSRNFARVRVWKALVVLPEAGIVQITARRFDVGRDKWSTEILYAGA